MSKNTFKQEFMPILVALHVLQCRIAATTVEDPGPQSCPKCSLKQACDKLHDLVVNDEQFMRAAGLWCCKEEGAGPTL